jgi:uncharacterized membrane protein YbhN (UPF0104 family)
MKDLAQTEVDDVEKTVKPKTWKGKLWSITKVVLKFAVTSALLYYVFSKVPLQKVKLRLIHANYWWMFAALVCFFASMVMSSWRLSSFFKSIKLKLDPRFNFRLYLLGLFYNFLLPGGIGGDGYKIYLLNKTYKLPAKKVFWAIMFDRLSGLWAIGLITVALIFLIPQIDIHIGIPLSIFVGASLLLFCGLQVFQGVHPLFLAGTFKGMWRYNHYRLQLSFLSFSGRILQGNFALFTLVPYFGAGNHHPYKCGWRRHPRNGISAIIKGFPYGYRPAVFLPISFYLISIIVALSGVYYVLRPSRLEEGLPKTEDNLENQQA